jgi:hypothetical protein
VDSLRDGRTRQIDIPFVDERMGIEADDGICIDEDDEKDLDSRPSAGGSHG